MKSRGTSQNIANRFQANHVEIDEYCEAPETIARVPTTLTATAVKRIISTNQSPDIRFDQSINPYQGCEHGCVYCFARPTHAFLDLSPGLDFETRLFYKPDAPTRLREELSRPNYQCKTIALGTNTDPYQPAEKRLRLTRAILEVASDFNQPVAIVTKSTLVARDIDLLEPLAKRNLCKVMISVTTLSNDLKRKLEPRTPSGAKRLATISELKNANIPVGVLIAPMIPKINDQELEKIVAACADAGAESAGYVLLRLPLEVRPLFEDWLTEHYPERATAVMSLVAQNHQGKAYRSDFGTRMRGDGPFADLLESRFKVALRRSGLVERRFTSLDTQRFRVPGQPTQLSLI